MSHGTIKVSFNGKLQFRMYVYWDSYPCGLGKKLASEICELYRKYTRDELYEKLKTIKVVTVDIKPSEEDKRKLLPYTDLLLPPNDYLTGE